MSYKQALNFLLQKPEKSLAIGQYRNIVGECCALGYLCPSLPSMEAEAIKLHNEKTGGDNRSLDISTMTEYCPGATRELDALDLTIEEAQRLQYANDRLCENNAERYSSVISWLDEQIENENQDHRLQ